MAHLVLLCLLAIATASDVPDPGWGTYRPHALASVRARVPNSPTYGFAWHPAFTPDVRHLAADRANEISSFSWRRHDGADYGEQIIDDIGVNVRITTHFVRAAKDRWALRFTGDVLDPAAPAQPMSVVFYGAAGVEAMGHRGAAAFSVRRRKNGVEVVTQDPALGTLSAVVHEPSNGSVDALGEAREKGASDASRTRRRKRDDADSRHTGLGRFFTALRERRILGARTGDGRFGFANCRAEWWWRFREALDPEVGDDIKLPPDTRLAAELAAPTWRLRGTDILVEEKAEIRKRLGGSTDRADAVIQAWSRRDAALLQQAGRAPPGGWPDVEDDGYILDW